MKLRIVVPVAFSLFVASHICAQTTINTAKLDSLFTALETNDRAMCAIAFAKNGQVLYHREIGYEREVPKTHTTPETEYRIGSITKVFTAVMIFQLIEEHKLSLQTKLSIYFPQIPNADSITIEQLLRHRSGIHNFTADSGYHEWMTEPKTEDQMLAVMARGKPNFVPGEKYKYSNSNFVLLGYILERITGHSYAEELEHRILHRIGLQHTYYGGKTGSKPHEAAPYDYGDSTWDAGPETDMSIPGGAGAMESTPSDLIQFIDALFHGKLVSKSSLDSMTDMKNDYGMGIARSWFHKRSAFGHNGGIDNFTSDISFFPDDSVEWVILGNGWRTDMNTIAIAALKIYYDLPYTIPSYRSLRLRADKLAEYNGKYTSDETDIDVKMDGNQLTGQATGQGAFPLEATDTDRFEFTPADIVMIFRRDSKGAVQSFDLLQSGRTEIFKKE